MADTTKINVLLIAPELDAVVSNVSQVNLISVNTISNNQAYTNTINSTTITYTSDGTATNLEIVAGLISAIEGNTTLNALVACTNNLDGSYYVTAKTAGTALTIYVSSKLTSLAYIANYNGDTAFNLFLADVKEELTVKDVALSAQEKAQRYLLAHLLTICANESNIGNLSSESVGRASVSYAGGGLFDPDMLSKTKYGAEFWRYFKKNRQLRGI